MALFHFGKKKEEKKTPVCACSSSDNTRVESDAPCCPEAPSCCCGNPVDGICCIKVLGAGCKSCHEQYEQAQQAADAMGLSVKVEYITDMQKVMEYGVMSMPAIVVNDRVVSMGKVLKAAEVEHLLRQIQS